MASKPLIPQDSQALARLLRHFASSVPRDGKMTRTLLVVRLRTTIIAALVPAMLAACEAMTPSANLQSGPGPAVAPAAAAAPAPAPANVPAVVVDEDRSGVYASGKSLSFDAALQPLDPSPLKEIRLDASNRLIDLA